MSLQKIKVKCPATIANLGSGFDVMGLCLQAPYDTLELEIIDFPRIEIIHTDSYKLSTDPQKNIVGVTLQAIIDSYQLKHGFRATIQKNIMPGSGVGSSAASAAGAAVAADILLGNKMSSDEIIEFALIGEALASGGRHADNIAPCVLGGLTLTRSTSPLDVLKLPYPPLYITVLHPQIELKTSEARSILKPEIPLALATKQWAQVGALVAGFYTQDLHLIARAMEDYVIEPQRKVLIPHFDEVKKLAMAQGALAGSISGAGPSMFFISENELISQNVANAIRDFYTSTGIDFHIYNTQISDTGVSLL